MFDKAVANEGLLATDSPMPKSLSDLGTQMRSKSIRRFFADLGITQLFARPHAPADNAEIESLFATVKGERLYKMSYDDPIKMINDVDSFVVPGSSLPTRSTMGVGRRSLKPERLG